MENNKNNYSPQQSGDKGPLWAILLTLGMLIAMIILKYFIG